MPTEKEIGASFGVGRTTVREALQGLTASGIVIRQGRRLVVVAEADLPAAEREEAERLTLLPPHDVFEARRLLEVESARLAALRHTSADLLELRRRARQLGHANQLAYEVSHQQFHLAVVRMSKNEALTLLFERNTQVLFQPPAGLADFAGADGSEPLFDEPRVVHERIVDAIGSGSATEAVRAMYEYFDVVERTLPARDDRTTRSSRPARRPLPGPRSTPD